MIVEPVSNVETHTPESGPGDIARRLAAGIARLDSGSAAALRRGPLAGAGAAAFWKLLATHEITHRNAEAWAPVVQAIAILTGAGRASDPQMQGPVHNPARPMGAALYDAGVSELRLARLLGARGNLRREYLVRLCRRLARDEHNRRFNLSTLAWFLVGADEKTDRRIAREYYYRAEATAKAKGLQQTKENQPNA